MNIKEIEHEKWILIKREFFNRIVGVLETNMKDVMNNSHSNRKLIKELLKEINEEI